MIFRYRSVSIDYAGGAFHSTKNSEISGPKLNGTVKIPGKVFENLGIRFECTLFDGISRIIENFVVHSQKMSGLVSLPSVGDRIYDTVPCLPHSKETAVFVFLAKLWAAQMNCQLDSVQCALFLVSITDTFSQSFGNGYRTGVWKTRTIRYSRLFAVRYSGFPELPRLQIRWNSYFKVPIYTSWFPPHKAGNCSLKYHVVVAIENGTTYCLTITLL